MVESKGHILMIKLCLVLKILCSLINLCWMHFPFSEMLLSPESTAEAMEHYKPDFRVKCFTQSCLGGLLHQNSLPPSLRITQMPWGPLCAPSPRVMWCWIWVLSLVWLGGAHPVSAWWDPRPPSVLTSELSWCAVFPGSMKLFPWSAADGLP